MRARAIKKRKKSVRFVHSLRRARWKFIAVVCAPRYPSMLCNFVVKTIKLLAFFIFDKLIQLPVSACRSNIVREQTTAHEGIHRRADNTCIDNNPKNGC
jgi:hypothetical protein